MAESRRRPEKQGDVQALRDVELTVYEAVAIIDKEGHTATVGDLAHATGYSDDTVRSALDRLVGERHVRSSGSGYALGDHDWGLG
jgi:DNA-binding IclR family transcriptional regulator